MSMHMIRGVQVHGTGKKKKKNKSHAVKVAEAELEATLKRVGYKGTKVVANSRMHPTSSNYKHDLGPIVRITSDSIPGNGNKKDAKVYTGNEIGGIAVMHKSNLVPIRKDNKDGFIDVAQMRRN